jgi:hypothetical protein
LSLLNCCFDLFFSSHSLRRILKNKKSFLAFILVNTMMTRRKWWKILIGIHRQIFRERTRWYTLFICQKKMNDTELVRDKSDKNFCFFLLCMISFSLFIQIFCFVILFIVISDVRMMSFVIKKSRCVERNISD